MYHIMTNKPRSVVLYYSGYKMDNGQEDKEHWDPIEEKAHSIIALNTLIALRTLMAPPLHSRNAHLDRIRLAL